MAHGILWDEFDGISKRIICPFGKNSLGPGAGDHPIYHQTSLLFFRASFKALLFSSTNQWECGTSMELDYGQRFKIDIYIYMGYVPLVIIEHETWGYVTNWL